MDRMDDLIHLLNLVIDQKLYAYEIMEENKNSLAVYTQANGSYSAYCTVETYIKNLMLQKMKKRKKRQKIMKELIKEVYRENRVSKRTGNAYQVIVIVFENGYHLETFLNNEQQYILANVPVR